IFALKFPDFLTQNYSVYDPKRTVENEEGMLYTSEVTPIKKFVPFEGLNTSGSISRGITVGNNQNAVTNSSLDLQITGKLSDKWITRAGDLFLENRKARFLNFNKKVQGLSSQLTVGEDDNRTTVFSSVALVRGQYAKSNFTGQEGNQGPYKLTGNNGELYVLVVSGSERVFVNGILLERGEDKHYVIDYNAGEIIFTSLFPITSEMRITVEYQFSERNYTRFVAYGGVM